MEFIQLLVLIDHIQDISQLELCGLCNFLLLFRSNQLVVIFLIIIHGTADLILIFKNFNFSVFTPKHQSECRFRFESLVNTFMKVVHVECLLTQEVLDVILELFLVFFIFPLFHCLHKLSLGQREQHSSLANKGLLKIRVLEGKEETLCLEPQINHFV